MKTFPHFFQEYNCLLRLYGVPSWLRLIITTIVVGSLTILWLGFFFMPHKRESKHVAQKMCDLHAQQESFLEVVKSRLAVECEKINQTHLLHKSCFGTKNSDGFDALLLCMRAHHLTCVGVKPQGVRKSNYYEKECYTVAMNGAFIQVVKFLDNVKDLKPLAHINGYVMKRRGNGEVFVQLSVQLMKKVYEDII